VRSFPEPGKGIKDCNAIAGDRLGGAGRDDIHTILYMIGILIFIRASETIFVILRHFRSNREIGT